MIEARHFVEAARERGFEWYAGVPCSYLTPFINYVLQDPALHYLSMANEGDAVALLAGVALGGSPGRPHARGIAMMQNSGLGNAVSPLTSLTWTFRLPQLLIVTWRAQPGVPDEPQHARADEHARRQVAEHAAEAEALGDGDADDRRGQVDERLEQDRVAHEAPRSTASSGALMRSRRAAASTSTRSSRSAPRRRA